MKVIAQLFLVLTVINPIFWATAQAPIKKKQQPQKKEIALDAILFSVFGRDLNEPKEYISLNQGEKLSSDFVVDSQKKLKLKFVIKDKKTNSPVTVHQAFVLLVHGESGREIVYLAKQADRTTMVYTFELDMKPHAKDFAGISGKYSISLVLGDALVLNALDWKFADLLLSIPETTKVSSIPKSSQVNYKMLPEIVHTFKVGERRPPTMVSDSFAVLCALPMIILFVLWLRIGLNFGYAGKCCSLWALGFHLGLAGIFGLYTCYWLKLNMFQTLQWLVVLAVPTLICGNRLLSSFSRGQEKKSKPE